MQLCWKENPHDRPGFSSLKNALSSLRTQQQQSVGVVSLNINQLGSYYKLHCLKKDPNRSVRTQPLGNKVDKENLARALEEELLDGERRGRHMLADVTTITRHSTGSFGRRVSMM